MTRVARPARGTKVRDELRAREQDRRTPSSNSAGVDEALPRGLVAITPRITNQAESAGINAVRANAIPCMEVRARLVPGRSYDLTWRGIPYVNSGTGTSLIDLWFMATIDGSAPTPSSSQIHFGRVFTEGFSNGPHTVLGRNYRPTQPEDLRLLACWGGRDPARTYGWHANAAYPSELRIDDVGSAFTVQTTVY